MNRIVNNSTTMVQANNFVSDPENNNFFYKYVFKARNVLEAVCPLFFVTTLPGLTPFRIHNGGVDYSGPFLMWTLLLLSVFGYCVASIRDTPVLTILRGYSSIQSVGELFQLGACSVTTFVTVTFNVLQKSKLEKILLLLSEIDLSLRRCGAELKYSRLKAVVCMHVAFLYLVSLIISVVVIGFYAFAGLRPRINILYLYGFSHYAETVETLFFSVCIYMNLRQFKLINRLLARSKFTHDGVAILRSLCDQSCDVSCLINSYFNVQILVIVAKCFLMSVFHLFFILEGVFASNLNPLSVFNIFYNIGFTFINFNNIIFICFLCTYISNEGNQTAVIVHKNLNKLSHLDEKARGELLLFSMQLHHRTPQFTAFSLFALNNTLLLSVVGSITTYLIILIQFAISPYNSDDNATTTASGL